MIKTFEQFNNKDIVAQVRKWTDGKSRVTIDNNGLIDVEGSVYLPITEKMKKIPFDFGTVNGSFHCNNLGLTTLEGAPNKVGESFICHSNNLTSFNGCPKKIGDLLDISNNNLSDVSDLININCKRIKVTDNPIRHLHRNCYRKSGDIENFIKLGVLKEPITSSNDPFLYKDKYIEYLKLQGEDVSNEEKLNDLFNTLNKHFTIV